MATGLANKLTAHIGEYLAAFDILDEVNQAEQTAFGFGKGIADDGDGDETVLRKALLSRGRRPRQDPGQAAAFSYRSARRWRCARVSDPKLRLSSRRLDAHP